MVETWLLLITVVCRRSLVTGEDWNQCAQTVLSVKYEKDTHSFTLRVLDKAGNDGWWYLRTLSSAEVGCARMLSC